MKFYSTRDKDQVRFSAAQVIKQGLANDGGLFVPEEIPSLTENEIKELCNKSYPERAAYILSKFLTDYEYDELLKDCEAAYCANSFPDGAAPLKKVTDNIFSLELWHGPTAAFKDMALQIMPRLLSRALVKTGETNTALILVATSGDTGKAALEGYKDIDRVKIIVFYPVDGVSKVQKLQMATQTGSNVSVCAIKGNFDDAQTGVKKIFSDPVAKAKLLENAHILSSANSINWGRLAPQIVYYVSAYCDLLNANEITYGETVNVCVPTGNFGNILAAYIAKNMGLPLNKFVCASNANNVLTDFLETGTYDRNRKFHLTMSPSMDILISSNLERLLYIELGTEKTAKYMAELASVGRYELSEDDFARIKKHFVGYSASEADTARTIKTIYEKENCLIDTHTAVAFYATGKYIEDNKAERRILTVSTASAYKFAEDVYTSLTDKRPEDGLAALEMLCDLTGEPIPEPIKGLAEKEILHSSTIDKTEMKDAVSAFAKG